MPKKSDPTAQAQEAQAALLAVASAYSMVSACLGEGLAEPRLPAVGGTLWKHDLADGEQLGDWLTACVMKTINSRRAGAAQQLLSRESVKTHLGASGHYGSRAGGSEPSDLLRGVEQLEKQLGKENGEPRELSRCEEAAPSPKRAALSERNPSASQAQLPARAAARAFEGRDQGAPSEWSPVAKLRLAHFLRPALQVRCDGWARRWTGRRLATSCTAPRPTSWARRWGRSARCSKWR